MEMAKKVLLVEGNSDKSFFEKICKRLSLDAVVQVAPPKDLGGRFNSKEGVFQRLEVLLNQLNDGQITHIALVVDADYSEHHGLGCQKTIDRVTAIVKPFDFELDPASENGLCFKHTDGFADLGLWVMPDNQQEGMLEDWIKTCVKVDEQTLFQTASSVVQVLENPKFSTHLTAKAEVATWLAWQKQPGHGLYLTLKDDLLDGDSPLFKAIEQWLLGIFKQR
jgi:hypothetical protein